MEGLRLAQLVVVMRELQVDSPRVHVHVVPKQFRRHDRALDVPPRPALTPRRRPRRFPRLGRLPQRKVPGALLLPHAGGVAALALLHLCRRRHTLGRLQLGVGMPRPPERRQVHINRPGALVRQPPRHDALDEGDDFGNVLGHARQGVGRFHAERLHVLHPARLEPPRVRIENRMVRYGRAPLPVQGFGQRFGRRARQGLAVGRGGGLGYGGAQSGEVGHLLQVLLQQLGPLVLLAPPGGDGSLQQQQLLLELPLEGRHRSFHLSTHFVNG
mmetsp:Transcript_4439/g.13933  ORF Transcript_4439/g.13933 Transcript_4439/m.13933 type:complete len:271 (-) Transcript_4439:402-1214(-)